MIQFLIALALFADDIYDGQADPWYARGCLARKYLSHWYQISDPYDWMYGTYIKPEYQRGATYIYWRLARKHLMKQFNTKHYDHRLYLSMRHDHCAERRIHAGMLHHDSCVGVGT